MWEKFHAGFVMFLDGIATKIDKWDYIKLKKKKKTIIKLLAILNLLLVYIKIFIYVQDWIKSSMNIQCEYLSVLEKKGNFCHML